MVPRTRHARAAGHERQRQKRRRPKPTNRQSSHVHRPLSVHARSNRGPILPQTLGRGRATPPNPLQKPQRRPQRPPSRRPAQVLTRHPGNRLRRAPRRSLRPDPVRPSLRPGWFRAVFWPLIGELAAQHAHESDDEVERILAELAGSMAATPRVGVLDVHRQGLRLVTDAPMDLDDDLPEALKVAAEQLRLRAKTDPEVAGRAPHHLYRLVREKPPPTSPATQRLRRTSGEAGCGVATRGSSATNASLRADPASCGPGGRGARSSRR